LNREWRSANAKQAGVTQLRICTAREGLYRPTAATCTSINGSCHRLNEKRAVGSTERMLTK
jgi:hypothetical protein